MLSKSRKDILFTDNRKIQVILFLKYVIPASLSSLSIGMSIIKTISMSL